MQEKRDFKLFFFKPVASPKERVKGYSLSLKFSRMTRHTLQVPGSWSQPHLS